MKKRIFSFLLCVVMLCGLLPIKAFAYIGAIRTTQEERAAVRTSEISLGGTRFLVLQNDYITFAVQKSGSGSALISYTAPTAQLNSNNDIFRFPAESNRFSVSEGDEVNLSAAKNMNITGISGTVNNDYGYPILEISLNFSDNRLTGSLVFSLERVNSGGGEGTTKGDFISKDLNEGSNHWAVLSSTNFRITEAGENQLGNNGKIYPYHIKEYPLSTMGHTNTQTAAPLLMNVADEIWVPSAFYSKFDHLEFSTRNITGGFGLTRTSLTTETGKRSHIDTSYTEIYTENYVSTNPFVGLSSFSRGSSAGFEGVEGHEYNFYAGYVESNGNKVTTYSYNPNNPLSSDWIDGGATSSFDSIWGFRNLYAKGDAEAPTQPDKVTISDNYDRLAVYISDGKTNVVPCSGSGAISGNPVAVIRGKFKASENGYTFTERAAALSPSVTATWGEGGSFTISSDGTITHTGLSLSAPSFKFYAPKTEGGLTLGFDSNGLTMQFVPDKNDAIFALDIPHATTQVTNGYADKNGNLRFTGSVGFSTIFDGASFTMEELGYGLKNGNFTVNGVKATGSFETAKLIGLDLAEVNGSINTFNGQESYAFDVKLDLFSMVKAEAELELKRLKSNGMLMPDDLYLYVGGKNLPVLTVLPTVPVAQITGGGLGFYNLADTINGNYYAIPPITLRGTVTGKYVQLLKGTTDTVIGPGVYEFEASNISIAGMESLKIINKAGLGLYMGGERISYGGENYSGVNFGGKANLVASLPSTSTDWIKLNGGVNLNLFGGLNESYNKLYVRANGNSRVSAALQFPSDWAVIGGKKLLGAGVDVIAGGQTVIPVSGSIGNGFQQAFNNMKLYLGIMAEAYIIGCGARIWVILPQSAATGDWWGYDYSIFRSLPGWSWDGKIRTYGAKNVPVQGAGFMSETAASTQKVTVNVTNQNENAYIVLAFDEKITKNEIKENLKITKADDGTNVNLIWLESNDNNEITNADTANVMSGVVPRSDGTGNDHVVLISLGKGISYNGEYTITTEDNNKQNQFSINSVYEVTQDTQLEPLTGSSSHDFTAGAKAINVELDTLGTVTFNGNSVSGSVENPKNGVTYVVRTYLANEQGGTDYLVDEQILSNNNFSVNVPTSGTAAPSGNYYITTCLMRQQSGDFDNDGNIEDDEIALLGIGSESSTSTISYTNDIAPATPSNVTLTAIGNEVMKASWQAVDGADGYKIAIYNADGTETGLGYEYNANQFSGDEKISGLNMEGNTYSIDMAMTVGGAVSDDETPITLEPNKSYKIGITAYKNELVGEQSIKYYGIEKQSDAVNLPEYTPLNMNITVGGEEITADSETGIYNASVPSDVNSIGVTATDNSNATFKMIRTDTNDELNKFSDSNFQIPEFEGMLMLEVTGSVTDGAITDTTTRYVLLSRDETAPIITLDEEIFFANHNGSYTVTGVTEAGATVTMISSESGADTITATAGEDGKFSLSGTLTAEDDSLFRTVSATDGAGNNGEAKAMITRPPEYTIQFNANGGSGTMNSKAVVHGESYTLPSCDFTPPEGKKFKGWATDTEGTTIYTAGTTLTAMENATFYAIWEDKGGSSGSSGGSSGGSTSDLDTISKQTLDSIKAAKDGSTVNITLSNDNTKLDKEVFKALAGRNVTLKCSLDNGVIWTVNGMDISKNADLTDIDLGVELDTSTIPVNVINTITGAVNTVQISLKHNGAFGFTMSLSAPLDKNNACYWANLYYFNKSTQKLEFQSADKIATDGTVKFVFDYASDYAIIIDNESHESIKIPFTDIPDEIWYENAVAYVYKHGLMSGTSVTTFTPDITTSRAMIATILWRMTGSPVVNYAMNYTDVEKGQWYSEAIRWATSEGIVTGYGNNLFGTNDHITREQFATMLWRYAKTQGYDVSIGENTNIMSYTDALNVTEYAIPAIQWAVGTGIINGTGDGSILNPQGEATRAQTAVMLMRFCEKYIIW